jgi:uncharacterized protein (DUF1800 family)
MNQDMHSPVVQHWLRLGAAVLLSLATSLAGAESLPQQVQARIDTLLISRESGAQRVQAYLLDEHRIRALPSEARRDARSGQRQAARRLTEEAEQRRMLRVLNSADERTEQLTWFWFNHFNVFWGKVPVGFFVADYEESAIRPHALGSFCAMLKAVTYHPAMLIYLDNWRNRAGKLNENHARELLELHTLGVDGGYTQADVQELARVLTGLGLPPQGSGKLSVLDLKRHDAGTKRLLGREIAPGGEEEVDGVLRMLCTHPSTARHLAAKLARYFHSDEPPAALVWEMARVFGDTQGDLRATVQALLASPHYAHPPPARFLEPYRYVVKAVRLVYGGQPVTNVRPLIRWLNLLGQPIYGRQTPDGYPLAARDWSSPGQMAARFDVAREIASAGPRLGAVGMADEIFQNVSSSESTRLRPETREALAMAASNAERLALLIASPEWMELR